MRDGDALERVIALQQFEMAFQPIVDSRQCCVLGYEALMRPQGRMSGVEPALVFRSARSAGRLSHLERACIFGALRSFAASPIEGKLFINVSPETLVTSEDLVASLLKYMDLQQIRPDGIVMEVTEGEAQSEKALQRATQTLRSHGVQIAIDDFGQGFSNFGRWQAIRPDILKLDRQLVHGITTDPWRQALVRSLVQVAHSCGSTFVAEGLERANDWATLRDLGIDLFQGHLFGRPSVRLAGSRPCDQGLRD